jgi:hypothetical protein
VILEEAGQNGHCMVRAAQRGSELFYCLATRIRALSALGLGLFLLGELGAQTLNVDQIMAQVAAHQDQAEQLRAKYTYTQKVRIRALRGNGKLSREEFCVYNVVPTNEATKKQLAEFKGRYESNGNITQYAKPGEQIPNKKIDIDAGVVPGLRDGLINDKESRDGLGKDLFPLTSAEEKKYRYELEGEEAYKGRPVYRIKFRPKKEFEGFDDNKTVWAGEALVDKADLQPISVTTHMSKGLPFLVKTTLGTNLHQLGFNVSYGRFDKDVYFPVSYGGEFDVKAVFFYKRTFTISLENTDFRRGEAQSKVTFGQIR